MQDSLHSQIERNMTRKHSFLKATPSKNKHHDLQLPRFYSSDEKKPKKNIFSQQRQMVSKKLEQKQSKHRGGQISKKISVKYSKTQKNETPTKMQGSIKTIKVTEDKWQQILKRGLVRGQQTGRSHYGTRKKSNFEEIVKINQCTPIQECNKVSSSENLNKIRYKLGSLQKQETEPRKGMKNYCGLETDSFVSGWQPVKNTRQKKESIKTARQKKGSTQQKATKGQSKPTLERVNKNEDLFCQYLNEEDAHVEKVKNQHAKQVKTRHEEGKLQKAEISYLTLMIETLRKTIRFPTNLDFPQVYIVSEKAKHEKIINQLLQQNHQCYFRTHLILSRLSFYLIAHYILLSMASRALVPIFTHLLDSQIIIAGIFGVHQKGLKKHYTHKLSQHEGSKRNQKEVVFAVENRGQLVNKNNQQVKSLLEAIFSKSKMPYCQLFQSLLVSSSNVRSFQFIAFLDKTLKWEILKMPSYPFLPPSLPHHNRHLILDLDQTLIHFDVDKEEYHVRPHAEQFIKRMKQLYQVTIFTAGTKEYADEIINQLDKEGNVKHRLYRNHLTFLEGESVKDLSMLGRPLKSTLIVDNLEANFRMNPDNGIAIKSWFNDGGDNILHKLEKLLVKIAEQYGEDLRRGLKQNRAYIIKEIGEKSGQIKIKYNL